MYTELPDEEADTLPPSFTAKLLYCGTCEGKDWVEPDDMGLDAWSDLNSQEVLRHGIKA